MAFWNRKNSSQDEAFNKAIDAIVASYKQDGEFNKATAMSASNPATASLPFRGGGNQSNSSTWPNYSSMNTQTIARLTQNLAANFDKDPQYVENALAEQGLSWGDPFPPGRPLDPFYGYARPARTWDYPVGANVQLTPRQGRIPFSVIKSIHESYYASMIIVKHLIYDVCSLDYQWIPPENTQEDATEDIKKAEKFFAYPDGRKAFRSWLAEYLQDVIRYDAGALYIRRNLKGKPIALEVVAGPTIMPLIDFFGRSPRDEVDEDTSQKIREMGGLWDGKTVPAYLQIIEGMPWDWLRAEDMIYEQINPLPESPYGLAPLESVLMQANTDIRFQWNLLQYFTEGTIPAGFMEAPPDLTDPNQVITWQNYWDSFMLGNQARLNQVVWVPNGANFTAIKKHEFNSEFSLYLMRCTAAAYGVVPNDLGFTEDVNKSVGEIQVDVQFRVGTLPIVRFVESILNTFTQYHLGLQARIQFDTGQGTQHRLERAQADDIYIKNGTLSNDEVRMKLGRRISKKNPVPRVFDNTRSGPIPLSSIIAVSQDIDATTYGPTNDALKPNFIPIPPPGVLPPKASPDDKRAGAISSNLYSQTLGAKGNSKAKGSSVGSAGSASSTAPTDSTLPSSPSAPSTPSAPPTSSLTQKDATAGITTATGATGVDLMTMNKTPNKPKSQTNNNFPKDYSEDEDPAKPAKKSEVKMVSSDDPLSPYVEDLSKKLHQWRMNSINRVKKNLSPRKFDDIPKVVSDAIWVNLSKASTPDQVWECFSGDVFGDVFMEKNTEEEIPDPIVAGIALVAQDTNKVVMVQRGNKHD